MRGVTNWIINQSLSRLFHNKIKLSFSIAKCKYMYCLEKVIQKWYPILNTRIIPLARVSKICIFILRTYLFKKKIQSLISLALNIWRGFFFFILCNEDIKFCRGLVSSVRTCISFEDTLIQKARYHSLPTRASFSWHAAGISPHALLYNYGKLKCQAFAAFGRR